MFGIAPAAIAPATRQSLLCAATDVTPSSAPHSFEAAKQTEAAKADLFGAWTEQQLSTSRSSK
jgi:hypothetical protein